MNRSDVPEYAEDAAILRFYNLDSLDAEEWVDDEALDNSPEQEKDSMQQFQHPEEEMNTSLTKSQSANDLQIIDSSDPLGVYSSIFPE